MSLGAELHDFLLNLMARLDLLMANVVAAAWRGVVETKTNVDLFQNCYYHYLYGHPLVMTGVMNLVEEEGAQKVKKRFHSWYPLL